VKPRLVLNIAGTRYSAVKTVVGITKANPGVVTITDHGFATGDFVIFFNLSEMTELNGTFGVIVKINAHTFSIVSTLAYNAETTGGACLRKVD